MMDNCPTQSRWHGSSPRGLQSLSNGGNWHVITVGATCTCHLHAEVRTRLPPVRSACASFGRRRWFGPRWRLARPPTSSTRPVPTSIPSRGRLLSSWLRGCRGRRRSVGGVSTERSPLSVERAVADDLTAVCDCRRRSSTQSVPGATSVLRSVISPLRQRNARGCQAASAPCPRRRRPRSGRARRCWRRRASEITKAPLR